MCLLYYLLNEYEYMLCVCYTIMNDDFFFQGRDGTFLNRGHRKKGRDEAPKETMQEMPIRLLLK